MFARNQSTFSLHPLPAIDSCMVQKALNWYKVVYFCLNIVFITLMYTAKPSDFLSAGGGSTQYDITLQAIFWLLAVTNWICFISLQGSSPGYVEKFTTASVPPALVDRPPQSSSATLYATTLANGSSDGSIGGSARVLLQGKNRGGRESSSSSGNFEGRHDGAAEEDGGSGPSTFLGKTRIEITPNPPTSSSSSSTSSSASAASWRGSGMSKAHDNGGAEERASILENRGGGSTPSLEVLESGGVAGGRAAAAAATVDDADEGEGDTTTDLVGGAAAEALARSGNRHCVRCDAPQPARAHHCRECGRCVHTFDHHCGVLGTCIGEKNRARFWCFLLTQVAVVAFCIGILNSSVTWRNNMSEWIQANLGTFLALLFLWILQVLLIALLGLHTWLAATNGTTYELSRGPQRLWYLAGTESRICDYPFGRGLGRNLAFYFCTSSGLQGAGGGWRPRVWEYPGIFARDSTDVCGNLWENRYWSCC